MLETKEISLHEVVVQSPGNIVSDMGGEKVMMSVENGKYYNLGTIGGEIWSRLETPITVNEVIESLIKEYEVEKEECVEQVVSFLQMLYKEKLIQVW